LSAIIIDDDKSYMTGNDHIDKDENNQDFGATGWIKDIL
jgi:hypothetical protein